MVTKMHLCRFWIRGSCDRPTCGWAHGEQEFGQQVMDPQGRKNRLCLDFANKGKCRKTREECPFAHGEEDLGVLQPAELKRRAGKGGNGGGGGRRSSSADPQSRRASQSDSAAPRSRRAASHGGSRRSPSRPRTRTPVTLVPGRSRRRSDSRSQGSEARGFHHYSNMLSLSIAS
jgi:hypothetical protein